MTMFQSHRFRSLISTHAISKYSTASKSTPSLAQIPTPQPPPATDTDADATGTPSESATEESPLPFLDRPLGVPTRPSKHDKITKRTERMIELLTDQEAIMEQRRMLLKQAQKPYFQDMLDAGTKHGGKTWIAPKVLIREDKALYLPTLYGKTLDTNIKKNTTAMCEGRITVLAMLGTKISEFQTKTYTTPTHTHFHTHPLYQHIQINLQENLLKAFLVNLFSTNLRSTVPPALHPTYLVSNQNLDYVRDAMGMSNRMVGYVFLVDEGGRIRWAACGDAVREEVGALESCTGVLLRRLERVLGGEGGKGGEKDPKDPKEKEGEKE